MGLVLRPHCWSRSRPHLVALGAFSPVPALSGRAFRSYRRANIPYPTDGRDGENRLRLRYLRTDDDGLFGHQCALRLVAGRDESRPSTPQHAGHLPHDLRLSWLVRSLVALYAVGKRFRWRRPQRPHAWLAHCSAVWLAHGRGSYCRGVHSAFPWLFRPNQRACATCKTRKELA